MEVDISYNIHLHVLFSINYIGGIFMDFNFQTDYRVEDFILNTQWEDLPPHIQQRAIVCSIDLTTALVLGSHGLQFQAGLRTAEDNFKEGSIPVVGSHKTFGLLGAAVAMGHASNSFDIDDGHNMIKGHPGTSFVAGILAAALEKGVSYREYLTTLAIAYEVAIRNGLALQHHYNYLVSTGAYGAFGTAAGIGRLYGLSREQLNTALSIAEFHAPLTPVMRSVQYPSMNKDGVPFGAMVGTQAVMETLAGSSGRGYLLELPEYQDMVDSLGTNYEIMNLYFKPYTCCRWSHQPIKASTDLMKEHSFTHQDVERMDVYTFDSAAQLSKIIPQTADQAQYNIAWPVASGLVFGDVGWLQVREEALNNPVVIENMKKLTFQVDPALDAQFPQKRLARVEITLKDGRLLKSPIYAAPGEHTDNVDLQWETEKFHRILSPVLSDEKRNALLTMLETQLDAPMSDLVSFINQ